MNLQYIEPSSNINDLDERLKIVENRFTQECISYRSYNPNNNIECGLETYFDNNYHYLNASFLIGGSLYDTVLLSEETFKLITEKIAKLELAFGINQTPADMKNIIGEMENLLNKARSVVDEINDLATRVESVKLDSKELLITRE